MMAPMMANDDTVGNSSQWLRMANHEAKQEKNMSSHPFYRPSLTTISSYLVIVNQRICHDESLLASAQTNH